MIRRNSERIVETKKMFNGAGESEAHKILNTIDEMYGKGRLFNHVVLRDGSEVGWHIHHGDGETYYILKGVGEYNDNGTVVTVYPGDVTITNDGEGHSIKSIGEEPLEMIALILYT